MNVAYRCSVVLIIYGPPSAHLFFINPSGACAISAYLPRLVIAYEVYHIDSTLKMPVSRYVLIIAAGRTIVGEAQPIPVLEVHVQETLICAIKAYAPLCQRQQCIVVTHVRRQGKYTTVEAIRPSNIWDGSEGTSAIKEFVGSSERYNICIDVYYPLELRLPP